MIGDQVQAIDELVVPGHGFEIEEEGKEPKRCFDTKDLYLLISHVF